MEKEAAVVLEVLEVLEVAAAKAIIIKAVVAIIPQQKCQLQVVMGLRRRQRRREQVRRQMEQEHRQQVGVGVVVVEVKCNLHLRLPVSSIVKEINSSTIMEEAVAAVVAMEEEIILREGTTPTDIVIMEDIGTTSAISKLYKKNFQKFMVWLCGYLN